MRAYVFKEDQAQVSRKLILVSLNLEFFLNFFKVVILFINLLIFFFCFRISEIFILYAFFKVRVVISYR